MIEHYVALLHNLAHDSSKVANAKICAGLLHKKSLIAIGFNTYKTHPIAKEFGRDQHCCTLHAEVDCLIKSQKVISNFNKSTLIICRAKYTSRGELIYGLAKPCEGCQRYIKLLGVKRVVFTLNSNHMRYQSENYSFDGTSVVP